MSQYRPGKHKRPAPEQQHVKKLRNCLACKKPFTSRWFGERVCGQCKATLDWQQGEAHGGR